MKILVMGLPGSGKTWIAERLQKNLECAWYNADLIREMANDWDFSPEGRIRQANRMRTLANFESANSRIVICDFVCPTKQTRKEFNPDVLIWMDTISAGRFDDTNRIFEPPEGDYNYKIIRHLNDGEINKLAEELNNLKL